MFSSFSFLLCFSILHRDCATLVLERSKKDLVSKLWFSYLQHIYFGNKNILFSSNIFLLDKSYIFYTLQKKNQKSDKILYVTLVGLTMYTCKQYDIRVFLTKEVK